MCGGKIYYFIIFIIMFSFTIIIADLDYDVFMYSNVAEKQICQLVTNI